MCLGKKGYEQVSRWASYLDDDHLQAVDAYYGQKFPSTLDRHIHHVIRLEIEKRLLFRRRQLKRSLWLSTRHGRSMEAVKRWLIRRRLWSSTLRWPRLPSLLDLLDGLIALLKRALDSHRLQKPSADSFQTSLERIRRSINDELSP